MKGASSKPVSLGQRTAASVLSVDPAIIYVRPRPAPFGLAGLIASRLQGRPLVCIARTMWTLEVPHHLLELAFIYNRFREKNPKVRIIIAANTPAELKLLRAQGIEAILANHNIFVDETVFRPLPRVAVRHAAIYNASFSPFKRRELCVELSSCAHLGYAADPAQKEDPLPHFNAARAALPQHHFLNPLNGGRPRRLNAVQVNRALATAEVGLCLSEAEGAMMASVEYLMAGLPVVTTPSLGGRDRYLNELTSITCEPNPRAVREAVEALRARALPRNVVRNTTMNLVRRDRAAFNTFVTSLREGRPPITDDPRFVFSYVPNLYELRPPEDFILVLGLPAAGDTTPATAPWYD